MKYPILFAGLLGGTILIGTIVLMLTVPVSSFLEEPLSTIVNIPQIMPYFTIIGTAIGIALGLFIYSAFKHVKEPDIKTKIHIGVTFLMGIIMIWTPYNNSQILFKIVHTIAGLGLMVNLSLLTIQFNKISNISNKSLHWIRQRIPSAMGFGTFGIFLLTGINIIMEIYFFTLAIFWLVLMALTIKEE